jgi:hypothetical protein
LAAYTNKGPYKKPKRDIAKHEIRRLIIDEGLTNQQISERINVPRRTVERYVSELYRFDNELLAGVNGGPNVIQHALTAVNICKERMNNYRNEILASIARNADAPFKDRMAAWNIICELDAAILRLEDGAPEMVARRTALAHNSSLVLRQGSTIVNMKLLDKPLPTNDREGVFKGEEEQEEEQEEDEEEIMKRLQQQEAKIKAKSVALE